MASNISGRWFWGAASLMLATVLINAGYTLYLRYRPVAPTAVVGPVHDFGAVFFGETKEHVFHVDNHWGSARTIARVASECGCAVPGAELQGKTVDAGEAFDIPVRWTLPNRLGPAKTSLMIFFTEGVPARMSLVMKARVRQRLALSPDRIDIETSGADVRSETVTVAPLPNAPRFELARVSTDSQYILATLATTGEQTSNAGKGPWRVTVSTVPPLPSGRIEGHIFFHGSDPQMTPVTLHAVVQVRPARGAAIDNRVQRQHP
jgi:hypothetical protein